MNKLIKIKNDYYIVDDSEIKENDYVYHPDVSQEYTIVENGDINNLKKGYHIAQGVYKHKPTINPWYKKERKITHSTQKGIGIQLNLEDIEELINGYSLIKLKANFANEELNSENGLLGNFYSLSTAFEEGFKAHEELSKDKLFTIDDMEYCYNTAKRRAVMQEVGLEPDLGFKDYMDKYHAPMTEWEIKFEDNKIVLI